MNRSTIVANQLWRSLVHFISRWLHLLLS
jgi:hypothetical protein